MVSKIDAFNNVVDAINNNSNFILEAGAGSGKTYTLIQVLSYLGRISLDSKQKILCITYTNVAKNEVIKRLESKVDDDRIYVATMHDFLWDFFSAFQVELRKEVEKLAILKKEKLDTEIVDAKRKLVKPRANTNIARQEEIIATNTIKLEKYIGVEYEKLNIVYDIYPAYYRGVISHDDIIIIANNFFKNPFFIRLFVSSFPYVLIDEYQDTNTELISNIVTFSNNLGLSKRIVIGLFGDKMQRIYENKNELDFSIFDNVIMKIDNYRSNDKIINANNILRNDSLEQSGDCQSNKVQFKKLEFIYNVGEDEDLRGYLNLEFASYKRLYLSNKNIANEIGFISLSELFNSQYHYNANEKLLKLDDALINFVINNVISMVKLFKNKMYVNLIQKSKASCINDLKTIKVKFGKLIKDMDIPLRSFIDEYKEIFIFDLNKYNEILDTYEDKDFLEKFLDITTNEFLCLLQQIDGDTTLSTMHGVKGAEFKNVIVNVSEKQRWTKYDFDSLLLNKEKNTSSIQAAHRLLYVSCTRAEEALILNYVAESYSVEQEEMLKEKIEELFGKDIKYVVLK